MIKSHEIKVKTQGNCHIIDITPKVADIVSKEVDSSSDATIVLFHVGSTGGLTTIEFEPGLVTHDINAALERIAPQNGTYQHELTWHDDNGHSHVRASLLGPSLSVPIVNGKMTLGTWQQIILVDVDTRARTRTVVCQIVGE